MDDGAWHVDSAPRMERASFDTAGQDQELHASGSPDQWPYPQVTARIVANAWAANPLAVVPCHRVIRADGELAGYRWGLERKRELLEKEANAHHRIGLCGRPRRD
jgi:hypothetical protein